MLSSRRTLQSPFASFDNPSIKDNQNNYWHIDAACMYEDNAGHQVFRLREAKNVMTSATHSIDCAIPKTGAVIKVMKCALAKQEECVMREYFNFSLFPINNYINVSVQKLFVQDVGTQLQVLLMVIVDKNFLDSLVVFKTPDCDQEAYEQFKGLVDDSAVTFSNAHYRDALIKKTSEDEIFALKFLYRILSEQLWLHLTFSFDGLRYTLKQDMALHQLKNTLLLLIRPPARLFTDISQALEDDLKKFKQAFPSQSKLNINKSENFSPAAQASDTSLSYSSAFYGSSEGSILAFSPASSEQEGSELEEKFTL